MKGNEWVKEGQRVEWKDGEGIVWAVHQAMGNGD